MTNGDCMCLNLGDGIDPRAPGPVFGDVLINQLAVAFLPS